MAWQSSTTGVEVGVNGVIITKGNNSSIISDDWSNDYLEIYGANDTVLGGGGSDSIGAILYPELGMNGNYAYIDGGSGSDVLIATAIQGTQNATLVGGSGVDSYGIGCNSDSTINAVFEDFGINAEPVAVFYENYRDGIFTCYSTDTGLVIRDDAGRLNATLKGVYDYNKILNDGWLWIYPHGVRGNNLLSVSTEVWNNGAWRKFGDVAKYSGSDSGITFAGNSLIVNDSHKGNIDLNYQGLENMISLDNRQSNISRILIGNSQANYIFAGNGNDSLWGGANNDILIGGVGNDNFFYGLNEGKDVITNSNWLDTVVLHNMTLNNISGVETGSDFIIVGQDMENYLSIQYNGDYSPLIKLADGSQYRYNKSNNSWQNS